MTDSQRKLLKAALIEACKDDFAHLPPEEEIDIVPSERFERRMKKLIRSQQKPYYVLFNSALKKVAAIAITLGICTSVATTVNTLADSMPEPNFYVRYQDRVTKIYFSDAVAEKAPDEVVEYYVPTYVPKGYKLESVSLTDWSTKYYKNKYGEEISFQQIAIVCSGISYEDDTETQYLNVNDSAGLYFYSDYYGTHNLTWSDGRYLYSLTGSCSKNKLVRMAESVELNEDFEEELIEMIKNEEISR